MKQLIFTAAILWLSVFAFSQGKGVVEAPKVAEPPRATDNRIYTQVEEQAQYPGGMGALGKFLSNNLEYPEDALEAGVEGKVMAKFVIGKDGYLTKISIEKHLGYGTAEEVVRVLKKMPKWIPAKNKGKWVSSEFRLPIVFQLPE